MAIVKVSGFTGEQPRIIPRLLPETGAKAASDVRLDDGGLTPMRQELEIATIDGENLKTIYRHVDTWLGWDVIVHASPGPVATERLYYTGDGSPKLKVGGDVYDLEVPPAGTGLTATLDGVGSGDVVTRSYVYTFVTSLGEESEPSPATAPLDWQPGNTVILSDFEGGIPDREITKQRIYRSQTGQLGTYYYLIAERDVETGDFTDNVDVDAFQEPLPSADWNVPPAGLRGLTEMPNGFFAAFVGNRIYFSEPYHPHAWPEKYALSTTFQIVGLGAIGGVLVVLTNGFPYVIQGAHPSSLQMQKIEANFPCINERSIVDLGYAVAFASVDGFAAVRADGSVQLVSAQLFSRDSYLALSPSNVIACQISSRYVVFYDTTDSDGSRLVGAVYMDLAGTPFIVRSSAQASAAWFDLANGALYFLKAGTNKIMRLDAPAGVRKQLYWRSKEFILPFETNFGCIRVDTDSSFSGIDISNDQQWLAETKAANAALIADGSIMGELNGNAMNVLVVNGDILIPIPADLTDGNIAAETGGGEATIGVYADGKKVASIGKMDRVARLPGGFKARKWEFDVSATLRITQVAMATTVDELRAGG